MEGARRIGVEIGGAVYHGTLPRARRQGRRAWGQRSMTLLGLLILLSGLFVGWNLGANDAANAMGTAVGARVRTIREAVIIVAVFSRSEERRVGKESKYMKSTSLNQK